MSIEIRQLLIKSDIVQRQCGNESGTDGDGSQASREQQKEQVLAECRKLVMSILAERGER